MKKAVRTLTLSLAVLLCLWSLALPAFADVIITPDMLKEIESTTEAPVTDVLSSPVTDVPSSPVTAGANLTFLYFGIGAAVIVVGLILFLLLRKRAK